MTPSWFNWRNAAAGGGFAGAVAVAVSHDHAIFLDSSGDVWTCGRNDYGNLGRVVASGSETSVNLGKVPGLSNIIAVAAGDVYSIFLDSSGEVWNCGYNGYGQLGRAVATGSASSVNLGKVPGLSNIIAVAASEVYSVFLDSSGNVWNCGMNNDGQFGRAVATGSETSVNLGKVPGLSSIIAIEAAYNGPIFLDSSGNVWNCGNNHGGSLGRAVATGSASSVNLGKVPGLSNIIAVAVGSNLSIFLNSSGNVWNCGQNSYGSLGRVVVSGSQTVVNLGQVTALSNIISVAVGIHSIFVNSSGEVWNCGYNSYGNLGRVVASGSETSVNLGKVPGLSNIIAVEANSYSIFVNSSGNVWNCGNNGYGQLGRAVATGSETVANLGQIPSA